MKPISRRAFAFRLPSLALLPALLRPALTSAVVTPLSAPVDVGRPGVAAIGLPAWSAEDVRILADALAASNRPVEVAVLGYSFNPANPWGNLDALLRQYLTKAKYKLTVTVYLDDGPNRKLRDARRISYSPFFRGDLSMDRFWALAGGKGESAEVRRFRADYTDRLVQPLAAEVRRWRDELRPGVHPRWPGGFASALDWKVVPQLEDGCREDAAFGALLTLTRESLAPLGVGFRRNGANRIAGYPLESHGLSGAGLRRYDVLSNDGSPTSSANYRRIIRPLLAKGVHALWWEASYNGTPRSKAPDQRGVIRPFTGSTNPEAKRRELETLLKGK